MKIRKLLMRGGDPVYEVVPFVLVAMALLVTGCGPPHTDYLVELHPQGDTIERTLELDFPFRPEWNTNVGNPRAVTANSQAWEADELTRITALYPASCLTNRI